MLTSSPTLIRLGGLAAMLGGLLAIVATYLHLYEPWGGAQVRVSPYEISNPQLFGAYNLPGSPALLLLAVGLIGLHARQAGRAGWLGKAGVALAYAGAAMALLNGVGIIALVVPLTFMTRVVGLLSLFTGATLLGIATLRTKILLRWKALPLAIGLLGALPFFVAALLGPLIGQSLMILVGVGWVLLGYTLWSDTRTAIQEHDDP